MIWLETLTLQCVFSATLPEMFDGHPPRREVRIAHGYARRRLSEEWGYAEARCAYHETEWRYLFHRPAMVQLVASTIGLYRLLFTQTKGTAPHV